MARALNGAMICLTLDFYTSHISHLVSPTTPSPPPPPLRPPGTGGSSRVLLPLWEPAVPACHSPCLGTHAAKTKTSPLRLSTANSTLAMLRNRSRHRLWRRDPSWACHPCLSTGVRPLCSSVRSGVKSFLAFCESENFEHYVGIYSFHFGEGGHFFHFTSFWGWRVAFWEAEEAMCGLRIL